MARIYARCLPVCLLIALAVTGFLPRHSMAEESLRARTRDQRVMMLAAIDPMVLDAYAAGETMPSIMDVSTFDDLVTFTPTLKELNDAAKAARLMADADDIVRGGTGLEEAINLYKKSLELNPADPLLMMALGVAQFKAGDCPGAINTLEKSVAMIPAGYRETSRIKSNLEAARESCGSKAARPDKKENASKTGKHSGRLDAIHLPVKEGGIGQEQRIRAEQSLAPLSLDEIAEFAAPNSPLVYGRDGEAHVIIRLEGMTSAELGDIAEATRNGYVVMQPVFWSHSLYPIVSFKFSILDQPDNPIGIEGPRDIALEDVQDFVNAVLEKGQGTIHVFNTDSGALVASGKFAVRTEGWRFAPRPYSSSKADLSNLWDIMAKAAAHLNKISETARDYEEAARAYLRETTL